MIGVARHSHFIRGYGAARYGRVYVYRVHISVAKRGKLGIFIGAFVIFCFPIEKRHAHVTRKEPGHTLAVKPFELDAIFVLLVKNVIIARTVFYNAKRQKIRLLPRIVVIPELRIIRVVVILPVIAERLTVAVYIIARIKTEYVKFLRTAYIAHAPHTRRSIFGYKPVDFHFYRIAVTRRMYILKEDSLLAVKDRLHLLIFAVFVAFYFREIPAVGLGVSVLCVAELGTVGICVLIPVFVERKSGVYVRVVGSRARKSGVQKHIFGGIDALDVTILRDKPHGFRHTRRVVHGVIECVPRCEKLRGKCGHSAFVRTSPPLRRPPRRLATAAVLLVYIKRIALKRMVFRRFV